MIAASRPLRFLALTLGGWTALRVAWLWPAVETPADLIRAIAPIPRAVAEPAAIARLTRHSSVLAIAIPPRRPRAAPVGLAASALSSAPSIPAGRMNVHMPFELALAAPVQVVDGPVLPTPVRVDPVAPALAPRLSAASWLIARGGRAVPFAGQLGGSQAGARLLYALGDARRISLAARFSSALGSRQREAALGFDWQPTPLPIHLFAEQRIGIEQARGGPSVGLIAGLPPTPVAGGFRLEGYGQAGGVARGGIEGFADGALRLARPIASVGGMKLDLGAGAWGGAQRGARRLDIGPSLGLALPVTGRALRLSLDWRQRIAGHAAPGSGPALSLGSDF